MPFFFMIVSQEPTSNGVKIEIPETSDNENPYLETPNISDLMPVIFPGGGGGQSGGGGASGDWFTTPVSGSGMLSEIATFNGYASDWTYQIVDGVIVASRERFLGSYTISRTGGGAWNEETQHRRGFDEPLKRLTIEGVDSESGYYLERYVFDGQHVSRNDSKSSAYPDYDYDAPLSIRDAGDYDLTAWLFDRSHGFPHMVDGNWVEYRCPSFSVNVPNRVIHSSPYVEEYRNITAYCVSDNAWHIAGQRPYSYYAEYDRYVDGVFVNHVSGGAIDYSYYLRDWPDDVLSQEVQRQHYPKIGIERVTLNYRPSVLPVILGGSLPSYLILIVIVLLCAVSNNSVTSSIDSDVRDDDQIRRYM